MKKIISILMLAMMILISGASIEAKKTTKKTGKRATTTSTAKIAMDSYGNYMFTGHVYKGSIQGVNMTIDFVDPYTAHVTGKRGYDTEIQAWEWRTSGDLVKVGQMTYTISDSGRLLTSTSNPAIKFRLVK